uniref:Uncharacterized protein n=1 Tax=Anopheles atroparvus TaxID=41427 RepID=A0A182JLG1_ANOAO
MSSKLLVQQGQSEPNSEQQTSPKSSNDSFLSASECTPEPHVERPKSLLQQFDHTLGVIWHCFDAFRQRFFALSTESISWALNFLESSAYRSTDELHFVVAYLRCVQALVQLIRSTRQAKNKNGVEKHLPETCKENCDRESALCQQPPKGEALPENLIEELLRLYALLARYKDELQRRQGDCVGTKQLQEIECLLDGFNDSLDVNDSSLVQ